MWELDHREVWAPKNSCFWTVVLEKTLESPLDSKGIQPVNPKGNQSWIFIGKMLKLKLQYFGHLLSRTDSLEKTLMLGKIEGRRRRGTSEDEIVGWHHWLDGHDFEQALGVSDGQRGLACCSPWGCKKLDMTERLNCVQLFVTPWAVACQASLSMGFSRQEYWSRLPRPPPGNLPDPVIKPVSPASLLHCRQILYCWTTGEANILYTCM